MINDVHPLRGLVQILFSLFFTQLLPAVVRHGCLHFRFSVRLYHVTDVGGCNAQGTSCTVTVLE